MEKYYKRLDEWNYEANQKRLLQENFYIIKIQYKIFKKNLICEKL